MIGLSIAYALAREGVVPTVLDRRELGREASWAGADLIPPASEQMTGRPRIALRSWSARLYGRPRSVTSTRRPDLLAAAQGFSRFRTSMMRPLSGLLTNSVGRGLPGADMQIFWLSPSSS